MEYYDTLPEGYVKGRLSDFILVNPDGELYPDEPYKVKEEVSYILKEGDRYYPYTFMGTISSFELLVHINNGLLFVKR